MNMATIKAIEARSVHQIQSGQVIVDLCSVAKELVENSLDAGATSIEVRFKNYGLDLVEVQDNGDGIAPNNYESIALKHYTSKLSTYDDLSCLTTFGFRGEALSSLCALSDFCIITAQADQAPKATKLEFEISGKLKNTQVVAGQKGTTASVGNLFNRLPVRRRELEKNIKREYTKVLNLLHAYACISTGVRFSVKSTLGKNKNVVAFATKPNPTTRENISNVYGAKTLLALIPLDLDLEFEPSAARSRANRELNKIHVSGHISRPVFGEGRQTPDRQMFFVNSRPCGLPQIAKAFNEVYKSFNISQSPFIFADFRMDTSAYDVNVSPDKRTILLHDSAALIDSLKDALNRLFEEAEQTLPQSQLGGGRQPPATAKPLSDSRSVTLPGRPIIQDVRSSDEREPSISREESVPITQGDSQRTQISNEPQHEPRNEPAMEEQPHVPDTLPNSTRREDSPDNESEDGLENKSQISSEEASDISGNTGNKSDKQQNSTLRSTTVSHTPNIIQNAFDRMRPRRAPPEIATITIGDKTVTSYIGSGPLRKRSSGSAGLSGRDSRSKRRIHTPSRPHIFGQNLKSFAAPGTQLSEEQEGDDEDLDSEDISEHSGANDQEEVEDSSDMGSRTSEPAEGQASREMSTLEKEADDVSESESSDKSAESNDDYIDEEEKHAKDEAKVNDLIRKAEEQSTIATDKTLSRANHLTKGHHLRGSTAELVGTLNGSISRIQRQMETLQRYVELCARGVREHENDEKVSESAEERLSLTVSKDDFAKMRIVGQFNLGFILATRPSEELAQGSSSKDELFIIDQHASDEKYNFERLQAETVVQNQRLVQPKTLDLTAVEEEIILENREALEKNGFVVEVDESGDEPIGRRCRLLSLPLSREVVFDIRDLEELIVLLGESPTNVTSQKDGNGENSQSRNVYVPRPSKVRKMFAMRACRSSIMIGKTLTSTQMQKVVGHMGTIDKPWNCPHGRPTMRHLMSLDQWKDVDDYVLSAYNNSDADPPRRSTTEDNGLDRWNDFFEWQAETTT